MTKEEVVKLLNKISSTSVFLSAVDVEDGSFLIAYTGGIARVSKRDLQIAKEKLNLKDND
jgi:hypothetical protein